MYNVPARFHTLAIADSPKTRCRIYFISDAVNCWDDNDVQTNGTLLVGAAGDTDSNGRIGQGGVTVTEIYNKDKNLTIGGTVSYQIGMTLVNSDGALNNFAFGRCKVYLDVYDDANSTWLPCPLGVFRIELPVKRKVQLISCSGYDQMQVLNAIADTWWNGLDFTGGLTIANILNSMVTQLGLHLSANSSTNMVNKTLSFTTPPIDSVERTYRDILGWIAEATGTVAHFNRDGELDMRPYLTPQIGGNNIVIDMDTTGNQCLSIDVAEYSVSQIDALTIKLTTSDQGVTVGSGTNVYTIMDNPFLYGPDVATIQSKLTPIYNRLSAYATYSPISTRLIYDWSIEAGDIIYILNNSTTYIVPVFQQKMIWRGGYVTSELISSGDTVRPQVSSSERETYRYNVEMATKVGDSEIISKINQTAEQIQIQASKVNLTGYITATNLATAGQTVINGGNITTGTISADRIAAGSLSISKLDSATQNTITTAASDASTALANAATAQSTANSANSQEQLIYISKVSGTTSVSGTTTWVTNTTGNQNTWTIKRPVYNSSYPVLFVATQRKSVGGTVTCTTPQIDQTTTVIDGGHITTGTIDAGVVNVTNINASNITSGTMSANKISGGTLTVGGVSDAHGKIDVVDSSGTKIGGLNSNGLQINGRFGWMPSGSSNTIIGDVGARIYPYSIVEWVQLPNGNYHAVLNTARSLGGTEANPYTEHSLNLFSYPLTGSYVSWARLHVDKDQAELKLNGIGNGAIRLSSSVDVGSQFGGPVTINSTLDVTQRRCYATLNSQGWYRVITVAGSGGGIDSWIANICITRKYYLSRNETHSISLLACDGSFSFVDEISKSNTQGISDIRYVRDGSYGYIDIYYSLLNENDVCVTFDVKTIPTRQDNFVSSNFSPVAASPSSGSVVAQHSFFATTGSKITFSPSVGTSFNDYGGCYYMIQNGICFVHVGLSGLSANTSQVVFTLPARVRPQSLIATCGIGGASITAISRGWIYEDGRIIIVPDDQYTAIDFSYVI